MDRVLHFFGGELSVMTEMRHDRDMTTTHFFHVPEQLNQRVGVGVRREALRPERQRPRPDAQVLDVRQVVRVLEGLQVLLEPARVERDAVLRRSHAIEATRVHQTRP